jgi:hypothetical protein
VVREVEALKTLFQIADETATVRGKLLELLQQYPTQGKQVHDANIVATMLAYEVPTLLTLNIKDMQRFANKITLATLEEG